MQMIKKLCAEIYEGKNLRENMIQLNQMVKSEAVLDDFWMNIMSMSPVLPDF